MQAEARLPEEAHDHEGLDRDPREREERRRGGGEIDARAEGERLASECGGDAAVLARSLARVSPAIRDAALEAAQEQYGNQFVAGVLEEQAKAPAETKPRGTAVPRTSPSKKGKDAKYKTSAWASARLFDELSGDQQALIDGYATAYPKPKSDGKSATAEPEITEGEHDVAPLAASADTSMAPVEAMEPSPEVEVEAEAETGPMPGAGALLWGELDVKKRAGFLNMTAAMRGNGFSLAGLGLLEHGIQQDRLLFTPASAASIKGDLDDAIRNRKSLGDRGFKKDNIDEGMHPGMADWGARQCVTKCSMQVGGGSGGVFVDIDKFNPWQNVVGFFGHAFEVLGNKIGNNKTDPFDVARELDKRGDDP